MQAQIQQKVPVYMQCYSDCRFGEDAASAEALAQLRLCPLATLLHIYQQAEPLLEGVAAAAAAGAGGAAGATGGSATVNSSQLASEQVGGSSGLPVLYMEKP